MKRQRPIAKVGFIAAGLLLMGFLGCENAPTVEEFLAMDANEADQLDASTRYQLIGEIVSLATNPVEENRVRLFDVSFQGLGGQEGGSEGSLISVLLAGAPDDIQGLTTSEMLSTSASFLMEDQVRDSSVNLVFDFDPAWRTDALGGLNGYSERELLELLADFASPYIRGVLEQYSEKEGNVVLVRRAAGAPCLASYDQPAGELELNPNYLRLVCLLPPSILSYLAGKGITGEEEFAQCVEGLVEGLLGEDPCDGNPICAIALIFVVVGLLPLFMLLCIPALLCGTIASSGTGVLLLATVTLAPLVAILFVGRRRRV